MATDPRSRGARAGLAALLLAAVALAQHPAAEGRAQPPGDPDAASRAEQKRGASDAPTHLPHPDLRPADALQHLRLGLDARLAAKAAGTAPPPPQPRPAGAGRYVVAVITCADADLDVPAMFGLARRDVLWISSPGPFVSPQTVALLEHLVTEERLSLVLLLGHDPCTTRTLLPTTPAQQTLALRLAALRRNARLEQAATKAFLLSQRDALLGASELLQRRAAQDGLRVVPGRVDADGDVAWLGQRVDTMPLQPVK